MTDRLQAFNVLAGAYSRARSEYPEPLWAALRAALDDCPVPPIAVDVGSGTGIASRQIALALPDWRIIGIEPGEGMRAQAVDDSRGSDIEFHAGTAEALSLKADSAGLVIAAQALHWFDRPQFYAGARRVLAPDGVLAIIQNNRMWHGSPFWDDYEAFLEEHSPGYSRDYRKFDVAGELREAGFADVAVHTAEWTRPISHELLIEMSRSTTKMQAAVEAISEAQAVGHLEALLERHCPSGHLEIPYTSELFTGRHCEDNDG